MPERGSKTSTVPVVLATFGIFLARSKWFPVAIGDNGRNLIILLWPGDKVTLIGVAAQRLTPPQKIPIAKIRWRSSRLDFLGSRQHPPHLLPSKGPNYQRGVLLISAGAIERYFEGKTSRETHQRGLVLAQQCPVSPSTCNPEETGLPGLPMSWSPTLFSGSGPVRLPPVPWTEKKLKCRHFSSEAEVISAAEIRLLWYISQNTVHVYVVSTDIDRCPMLFPHITRHMSYL